MSLKILTDFNCKAGFIFKVGSGLPPINNKGG
jgi:hypothetical protein